jgi:sigma-E factor negative regulatory protein RseA
MTDEQRSQVSVLMDGELDGRRAARLFDLVGREPEMRAAWERYHLIGQAIRGERIEREARGLADAVRRAVEREPTVIVPSSSRLGRGVPLAPFAGAVLAAGVAILAILAVPSLFQGPEPDGGQVPMVERYARLDNDPPQPWNPDRQDLADKLDLFLVNHQEAAPATGLKGMLPYATLVGYDSGR